MRGLGLDNLKQTVFAVGSVAVAAGMLFTVAVASARGDGAGADLDLEGLVRNQQVLVERLESEVKDLSSQADSLTEISFPTAIAGAPGALATRTVEGPGVVVTMDDAPSDFRTPDRANVNDLVVHQQDVDAVMNALWRGGAEAMSIQGVRITNTTPVRCVGSVILIGVRAFAPPYVIEAVGDAEGMASALAQDPQVERFRHSAQTYRMGWNVEQVATLTLPSVPNIPSNTFATPLDAA